jgi:alpha-beta hydrolase superfamily lysophospholipase
MEPLVPRIEFYTAADGRRLAARVWSTQEAPRARVVFLHGITSHSGWYHHSCRHLAAAGLEVHFLDRRGSGLNAVGRGDVDRYETWIADVEVYLEELQNSRSGFRVQGSDRTSDVADSPRSEPQTPNPEPYVPTVLAGISWGGKLAVVVARSCSAKQRAAAQDEHRPDLMQGLALICPGLYAYQQPGLLKRLFLASPLPPRLQARRVTIPLADPRLFTDSPAWVDYVANDPLSLREVTLRFAREDLMLTEYARESNRLGELDTLLVLSGRDRIVNNTQTRAYFDDVEARSKRVLEYASAAHTLDFEPDPGPYFADLTEWIVSVSK